MSFWEGVRVLLFGHSDKENIRKVRNKLSERPQLNSESFAITYFPEEKQAVARRLWEITKEHSVADITGVIPEDMFVEDLKMDDLDSLSLVEYTIHIEKDFVVNVSEERAKSIRTLGELVEEVWSLKNSAKKME